MPSFAAPPRLVLFVAFPRMGLLDLSGPQTVFWTASRLVEERGLSAYERHTVSLQGGLVRSIAPDMVSMLDGATPMIAWLRTASARSRRTVAVQVARELVVFLKRPGGQPQYSELLKAQSNDSVLFDDPHLWLVNNLSEQAIGVSMSPRNFARVYKQKTGRAPGKAVEMFRLEAARRLLQNASRNLDQIARQCGFGDQERMRVTFQRKLGISPSDYRKRYTALNAA